jgi:hypothetical protein
MLAAEILFQGGRTRTAREILAEIARFGPRDEDRAKALYLLGEHYFFLQRYAETDADGEPVSGTARYYWEILTQRYPDSSWTERAARPLRYARLVSSREVPDFQSTFEGLGGAVTYSRDDLRGKLVVLDFWRSSAPGQKDRERRLVEELSRAFRESPALSEKVVILGVNLDPDRAMYETARAAWELPWPQVYDGEAFRSPLATAFAIPQVPHRALIDPQGRLAYLGADDRAFRAALKAALEALEREADDPEAASDETGPSDHDLESAPEPDDDAEPEEPSPEDGGASEEPSSGSSAGR